MKSTTLLQGLGPTLVLSVPAMGLYLTTYDESKRICSTYGLREGGFACSVVSGIAAELLSGVLFVPMEVVKKKLQVESAMKASSLIKAVYKKHGFYGFYRGYGLNMGIYIPYSVTYFTVYEMLKIESKSLTKSEGSFILNLSCAFVAAGMAGAVSNPLDVISTRVQIATDVSTFAVIKDMYVLEGGLRPFAKGIIARVVWAAPSMALTVAMWEFGKSLLM